MGIFNTFGAVSGQMSAKQEHLQIAKALIEEFLKPGKLAATLSSLKASDQGNLLRRWISGDSAPVTATAVQQGIGQCTLLTELENRTRMPSGVVKAGLAVLLPIAMAQLARDGDVTAEGDASAEAPADLDNLAHALR